MLQGKTTSGRSIMNTKKIGLKIDPCETPEVSLDHEEETPSITTVCMLVVL